MGEAIQQRQPLRSDAQEALLTLLMTTEQLHWPHEALFTEHGLTAQQFNVLRILRGAGDTGMPTLDIAARMVQRTPGITRLLDKARTDPEPPRDLERSRRGPRSDRPTN